MTSSKENLQHRVCIDRSNHVDGGEPSDNIEDMSRNLPPALQLVLPISNPREILGVPAVNSTLNGDIEVTLDRCRKTLSLPIWVDDKIGHIDSRRSNLMTIASQLKRIRPKDSTLRTWRSRGESF